jgi:hypothetical protein
VPWWRRRNVSALTLNLVPAARYESHSPGSAESIAAIASNIRLIVVELSRVEKGGLWVLRCSRASLRVVPRYAAQHGSAASRSVKMSEEHQNFTPYLLSPHISATNTAIPSLRAALDLQSNSLQNGFLRFAFYARGSVTQRCATMGTGGSRNYGACSQSASRNHEDGPHSCGCSYR